MERPSAHKATVDIILTKFIKLIGKFLVILLVHVFSFLDEGKLPLQIFNCMLLVNCFKLKFCSPLFFTA